MVETKDETDRGAKIGKGAVSALRPLFSRRNIIDSVGLGFVLIVVYTSFPFLENSDIFSDNLVHFSVFAAVLGRFFLADLSCLVRRKHGIC